MHSLLQHACMLMCIHAYSLKQERQMNVITSMCELTSHKILEQAQEIEALYDTVVRAVEDIGMPFLSLILHKNKLLHSQPCVPSQMTWWTDRERIIFITHCLKQWTIIQDIRLDEQIMWLSLFSIFKIHIKIVVLAVEDIGTPLLSLFQQLETSEWHTLFWM